MEYGQNITSELSDNKNRISKLARPRELNHIHPMQDSTNEYTNYRIHFKRTVPPIYFNSHL